MTRVDLPNGEWVDLRDPATVSERLRRPVFNQSLRVRDIVTKLAGLGDDATEIQIAEALDADQMSAVLDLQDLVIVALVEKWSFPVDISLANVLELPGPAYDALKIATAPLTEAMMPDFSPSDPSDRSSPTGA